MGKQPYIVVLRQLGGVGDVLMMSPVYRGLREKFPKHKICLATGLVYLGGALMDLAKHNPFIDEVHTFEPWDATTEMTRHIWKGHFDNSPEIADDLWWKKADVVIDLNTACVEYEWAALQQPGGIQKNRTQIWCERAEVTPSSTFPIYEVTKSERKTAIGIYHDRGWDPGDCVGVGVTSHDKKRAIGEGKLLEICKGIRDMGLRPVVIDPTFKFPDFDSINGMRISDLMPLIQQMRMVVSVDSGILHMAGALKVPVVGIFGPTDPDMRMTEYVGSAVDPKTLMPCSPCWYLYHCMKRDSTTPHFECLNKLSHTIILEEIRRWKDLTGERRHLSGLPVYNGR